MWLALFLACAGTPEPEPVAAPETVAAPAPEAPAKVEPPPVVDVVPPPIVTPIAAPAGGPPVGYEACKEEWRGGGCTREHRDTCGILGDGTTQTFANPCVACRQDTPADITELAQTIVLRLPQHDVAALVG